MTTQKAIMTTKLKTISYSFHWLHVYLVVELSLRNSRFLFPLFPSARGILHLSFLVWNRDLYLMERYKQIKLPTYKNRSVRMLMDFWGKLVSNNVKFLLDGVSNLIHFLFQTIKAAMLERKENHCLRQTCMSVINLLPQYCFYQPMFSHMFFWLGKYLSRLWFCLQRF